MLDLKDVGAAEVYVSSSGYLVIKQDGQTITLSPEQAFAIERYLKRERRNIRSAWNGGINESAD